MSGSDFVIGGVAVAAALAGRALAPRTGVPYAVFLVLLGAAGSFLPGLPPVHLRPSVVFLVFLPPLVYRAGFVTSPRELAEHATSIALSAFGLVLATTFAVAAGVHALRPGMGWAAAVVLGAAVAPTDPVSATTVLGRVGAPRRIATILEGEGLVNDGIALTLLSVGIAAVSSSTGATSALVDFVKVAAGGSVFGVAVAVAISQLRRLLRDSSAQLVLSLATPYLAYVAADALGLSGILSAVVAGLYLGQSSSFRSAPSLRIQAEGFWVTVTFLLESWLFVLVGLQFRSVAGNAARYPLHLVLEVCGTAIAASVVTRMAWQLLLPAIRWRPSGRLLDTGQMHLGERIVLGWSGLRGAISLAAVLSVPTTVDGRPFPDRPLLLLATFCVIAFTLVGQGATLPLVIRAVHASASDEERNTALRAQRHAIEAALRRINEMSEEEEISAGTAEVLNEVYQQRLQRVEDRLEPGDDEGADSTRRAPLRDVQLELISTQRRALRDLFDRGEIGYAVLRQQEHDLDLEQESSRRR